MKWPVLLVLLTACYPDPATPTTQPPCAAACEVLRDLGCESAATTPAGATCETVCETTERSGYATTHPECVALARDCAEAERVSAHGCAP